MTSIVENINSSIRDVCLVCFQDTLHFQRAVAPCGHDDICAQCHIRLRSLHNDKKCPICKSDNAMLVVDTETTHLKSFADYEIWGNELGGNFTFQEDLGMLFSVQYYKESVLPLFSLGCGVGSCPFDNKKDTFVPTKSLDPNATAAKSNSKNSEKKRLGGLKALQEHLRIDHGLTLCSLCVEGKRDFVSNLPRFTPSQLNSHLGRGDGTASGFKGHPVCKFCKPKRFYDLTKLHEHLNMQHYKCHVCDKQGLPNQFFKGYQQLCIHFDREHFLCPDPQCIAARFVVFENEIDLRAHELSVHGASLQSNKRNGSAKIQLEFRIHRTGFDGSGIPQQSIPSDEDFQYGLDGEVFVPDALPNSQQENEPVLSHPLHAARTAELRAQAQIVREQQRLEEQGEAFPTLQASVGESSRSQQQLLVGWTSSAKARRPPSGGKLNVEDFPALASSTKKPVGYNPIASAATTSRVAGSAKKSTAPTWADNSKDKKTAPPVANRSSSSVNPVAISTPPTHNPPSLNSKNFPSLGRPGSTNSTAKYAAAVAFSKQKAEAKHSKSTDNNFLSLNSTPLTSITSTTLSSKEQIEKIKGILGPTNYSKLKNMTKEFANGSVEPREYVNFAASLFRLGVKDPDFLSFVPNLIQSCPDNSNTLSALSYLQGLAQQYSPNSALEVNSSMDFPSLQSSTNLYTRVAKAHTKKTAVSSVKSTAWGNNS